MINSVNASTQDNATNENENENNVLNSAVRYREESLEYNELCNQVEQEYYHKIHGCSVRNQNNF